MRRLLAIGVSAAVLGLVPSSAAGTPIGLETIGAGAYYTYHARSGTVLHGAIRVTNRGSRRTTTRLYGVDAATGPTTGASYLTDPGRGRKVARWIRLTPSSVDLAPHSSRQVRFAVSIPRGTSPGDFLGGIAAEGSAHRGAATRRGRSTFRINVRTVAVIAVKVAVPGARKPALGVTGVTAGGTPGHQQIFIGLTNTGNQLLKGRGAIVVRRAGRIVKRAKFPIDTFVPSTHVEDPVLVPGRPLGAGHYIATVTLRYGHRTSIRTAGFTVGKRELREVYGSPPAARASAGATHGIRAILVAALALLLVAMLAAVWSIARRRTARRVRAEIERELALRELELRDAEKPVDAQTLTP